MGKKRASLSDKLEALAHQDARTAAGVLLVLRALAERHDSFDLHMAVKGLADFVVGLTPGATAQGEEPRG